MREKWEKLIARDACVSWLVRTNKPCLCRKMAASLQSSSWWIFFAFGMICRYLSSRIITLRWIIDVFELRFNVMKKYRLEASFVRCRRHYINRQQDESSVTNIFGVDVLQLAFSCYEWYFFLIWFDFEDVFWIKFFF